MTTITTRKVQDPNGREYDIHAWYLVRNGWEYWQTEPTDENGYTFGYVMGDACEWGSFNVNEIKEFMMSCATGNELYELAPPSDRYDSWKWKENQKKVKVWG